MHTVSTHCDLVVGVVVVSGVAEARSIVRHHAVIVKSEATEGRRFQGDGVVEMRADVNARVDDE